MNDLSSHLETRITTNSANQVDPVIYGERIVWTDNRYVHSDIFMMDLATNTETRLTTSSGEQFNPQIYDDRVVWIDNRHGIRVFMNCLVLT
jgi:beta propeller repeat protein